DVVVGSSAGGAVGVYDPSLGRWVWTTSPLGQDAAGVRVSAVVNVNAPGAVVVTATNRQGAQESAVVPWKGSGPVRSLPAQSPGSGSLVPLAGGYVYQRSTIRTNSSFPFSNGPVTPTVIFGATG